MSVLVCLLERMFMRGDLLPLTWLEIREEERDAGLMVGILFDFSSLRALSSMWRVFLLFH